MDRKADADREEHNEEWSQLNTERWCMSCRSVRDQGAGTECAVGDSSEDLGVRTHR